MIFAVYERKTDGADVTHEDLLRPGRPRRRGYCMYGSAIDFVVTFKAGVQRFTLDDRSESLFTRARCFPEAPKTIYSVNEGNSVLWDAETQAAVAAFKARPSRIRAVRRLDGLGRAPNHPLRRHLPLPR